MSSLRPDAQIASRHEDGSPAVVMLPTRHTVDGVACAHMIHLHESGRLAYAVLAEARDAGGFALEAGDSLSLRDDGKPERVHFQTPRDVRGHAGVRSVGFDENGDIQDLVAGDATIDARGIVRRRRLAAPETIAGIPCMTFAAFDEEGRLFSTTLAADHATAHGTLPAGSMVQLRADGTVASAQISGACVLDGERFERNDPARFQDGKVVKEGWVFYTP